MICFHSHSIDDLSLDELVPIEMKQQIFTSMEKYSENHFVQVSACQVHFVYYFFFRTCVFKIVFMLIDIFDYLHM